MRATCASSSTIRMEAGGASSAVISIAFLLHAAPDTRQKSCEKTCRDLWPVSNTTAQSKYTHTRIRSRHDLPHRRQEQPKRGSPSIRDGEPLPAFGHPPLRGEGLGHQSGDWHDSASPPPAHRGGG